MKRFTSFLLRSHRFGWLVLPVVLGSIFYAQNARLSGSADEWVQYVSRGIVLVAGLVLLQFSLVRRKLEHWQAAWQSVIIGTAPGFAALVQSSNSVWVLTWLAVAARGALPQLTPVLPLLFFLQPGDLTTSLLCWGGILVWNGRRFDWLGWAVALGLALGVMRFGLESPEVTLVQWSPSFLYLAIGAYGVAGVFALSGFMQSQPQFSPWRGWLFALFTLLAFSQSREWGVVTFFVSLQAVSYWQAQAYSRLAQALKPRDQTVRLALMVLIALLNGAETAAQLPWDDSALPRYVAAAALLVYAERRARR